MSYTNKKTKIKLKISKDEEALKHKIEEMSD